MVGRLLYDQAYEACSLYTLSDRISLPEDILRFYIIMILAEPFLILAYCKNAETW